MAQSMVQLGVGLQYLYRPAPSPPAQNVAFEEVFSGHHHVKLRLIDTVQ